MTKALDIIKGAYELIGVADPEETIDDALGQRGVKTLNQMIARWQRDGVGISYTQITTVQDDITAPIETHEAIEANLALKLAPRFGRSASAEVQAAARYGYDALLRDSQGVVHADLSSMPQTEGAFDIVSGDI